MKMLPMDVIRIIRSFMTFRERSQMINKQWIKEVFYKGIKLGKWKSKRRLYTYMKLFGSRGVNITWAMFCKRMLHRNRRARNQRDQLTWRAAAMSEMEQNVCQSCGKNTKSNVFGVHLCFRCRACSHKKFAYMVNVQTAISFGIPRRILKEIPVYYGGMCGKYRFWHEIQGLLRNLN